jgi:hypothetical protein
MRDPNYFKPKQQPCDDNDKDGVCDFLDKEPNTAEGCAVDTHGVTLDTDGDGVPDCKDNEKITPTQCQKELTADGVGKCPDPECCDKIPVGPVKTECSEKLGAGPLAFNDGSCKLTSDAMSQLDELAMKMKSNADCNIKLSAGKGVSKAEQRTAECRNKAIINYLVNKKGISKDRIMDELSEDTDVNTVDVSAQ